MQWLSDKLRDLGYIVKVYKIPKRTSPVEISSSEMAFVRRCIRRFTEQNNESLKEWNSYLSKRRLRFFHELVQLCISSEIDLEKKDIADIGYGTGYLFRVISLMTNENQLFGYDTYEDSLELAKLLCPSADFHIQSIYDVDRTFDIFFCTEVLEHLVNPSQAINKMRALSKPGGILVLTVPNGRLDIAESGKLREDGSGYWGHIHFWSPESWELFLQNEVENAKEIKTGSIAGNRLYGIIYL